MRCMALHGQSKTSILCPLRYAATDERPNHPVTGRPADGYYLQGPRNTRTPYWTPDPANKLKLPLEERYFSVREAAVILGRTTRTVWSWIQRRQLRAARPKSGRGSMWLIKGADLMAFIDASPERQAVASVCDVRSE